jgi:hypothetical protein
MAVSPNRLVTAQAPRCGMAVFQNADSTNLKTVFTPGPNGSKVLCCIVSGYDNVVHTAQWIILRGTGQYWSGSAQTPAGGWSFPVDLFSIFSVPGLPYDDDGQRFIYLEPGDLLQARVSVAIVAPNAMTMVAFGADF